MSTYPSYLGSALKVKRVRQITLKKYTAAGKPLSKLDFFDVFTNVKVTGQASKLLSQFIAVIKRERSGYIVNQWSVNTGVRQDGVEVFIGFKKAKS